MPSAKAAPDGTGSSYSRAVCTVPTASLVSGRARAKQACFSVPLLTVLSGLSRPQENPDTPQACPGCSHQPLEATSAQGSKGSSPHLHTTVTSVRLIPAPLHPQGCCLYSKRQMLTNQGWARMRIQQPDSVCLCRTKTTLEPETQTGISQFVVINAENLGFIGGLAFYKKASNRSFPHEFIFKI